MAAATASARWSCTRKRPRRLKNGSDLRSRPSLLQLGLRLRDLGKLVCAGRVADPELLLAMQLLVSGSDWEPLQERLRSRRWSAGQEKDAGQLGLDPSKHLTLPVLASAMGHCCAWGSPAVCSTGADASAGAAASRLLTLRAA